jgi:GT2 family glycosyltransferase
LLGGLTHDSVEMTVEPSLVAKATILIVAVLYERAPDESCSLCFLAQIFKACPELARHFSVVIFDNSSQSHRVAIELNLPVLYKHDPANPGLAGAYNFALNLAQEGRFEWLLLLDQDTSLTREFILEVIESIDLLAGRSDVAAIVPKLLVNGRIFSPAAHFIEQLRHQYKRSNHAVVLDTVGVQHRRLFAYNSGAALRVSALRAIGGFPQEFWLDYLDHAVFHALHTSGYRVYVMHTQIPHDASQARASNVPIWRQRNILIAQNRFVRKTGTALDRLLYRIWLLRWSRSLWINHVDRQFCREVAIQASCRRLDLNENYLRGEAGTPG